MPSTHLRQRPRSALSPAHTWGECHRPHLTPNTHLTRAPRFTHPPHTPEAGAAPPIPQVRTLRSPQKSLQTQSFYVKASVRLPLQGEPLSPQTSHQLLQGWEEGAESGGWLVLDLRARARTHLLQEASRPSLHPSGLREQLPPITAPGTPRSLLMPS